MERRRQEEEVKASFRPHKQTFSGQKKALQTIVCKAMNKKLGSDLLFHTLVCSTIGDEGLDF